MECDEAFLRKVTQQEGLLFDRKAYVELWDDRHKASFIKDIIALANTSRFTGKKSELILGVEDDGTIHGIEEMINRYGGLDNLKRKITQEINNFISPQLSVVDIQAVNCDGHVILVINIPALPTDSLFKVKRNLGSIESGQCWIRTGESNTTVSSDMERFYLPFTKCPYIFPEQWQDYFTLLQARFEHSINIKGYQELFSNNGKEITEEIGKFLNKGNKKILVLIGEAAIGKTTLLERFAFDGATLLEGDIRNQENLSGFYYPFGYIPIFVSLRDMYLKEVRQLENLLVDRLCEGLRFPDKRPEELNRLFESQKYHFVALLDGIDELFNEQARRQFIQVLQDMARRYPELKFILATRPPKPSFAEEYRSEIVEINIQPFTREQIRRYIEVYCDSKTLEKVERWIYSDEELTRICSIPFYLETALPEIIGESPYEWKDEGRNNEPVQIENEEDKAQNGGNEENLENLLIDVSTANLVREDELILEQPIEVRTEAPVFEKLSEEEQNIRIGVLLDRVYRQAWIRETQKKNFQPAKTRGFWRQAEKLAISVNLGDEISDEQIGRIMSTRAILFCLGLSVLTESEEMRAVRFFTELTQVIFAANQLKRFFKNNPQSFNREFNKISNRFREKITPILQELSPDFYILNS